MKEADIIISHVPLTQAQSFTLRVAVESFRMFLSDREREGDATGKWLSQNYAERAAEISELIRLTAE